MKHGPERNDLLFHLPQQVKERVFPLLCEVELSRGKEINAAGEKIEFVYFPADCLISVISDTLDGQSTQISVVGHDGSYNVSFIMGADSTLSRAVVVSAGTAYRLRATDLKREFDNDITVCLVLLRYIQTLITQVAQTAVCNRHHTIDQRLCRWLLQCLDRLSTNELTMTQELIASMLGVRREGVTEAACKLQKLGVIRYQRGRITVLDRPRLETLCCECYTVVKKEADRLGVSARHGGVGGFRAVPVLYGAGDSAVYAPAAVGAVQ